VERRFGGAAVVAYFDTADEEIQNGHAAVLARIQDEGLLFPVTVIDGQPVYDGAVSHAVILRAIQNKLQPAD
jgi:disulfide oxidoreductase YuzD